MESNPLLATDRLPEFSAIRPEHIESALTATLAENRGRLEALLSGIEDRSPDFATDILPLEELGDRLGRVWGPVGHLHAVCNSPELRDAYNACLPALSRYRTELAQDTRLWKLYQRVGETLPDDADPAMSGLVGHALRDFHLAGVDLPDDRKHEFKTIVEELTELGARFEQNVLDSMTAWSEHVTDEAILAGLPNWIIEQAAANAREHERDGWLFRLDQPSYLAVARHAEDRDFRRRFYRAWVTRASDQAPGNNKGNNKAGNDGAGGPIEGGFDNAATIERILALRHDAATIIGFENFAAYSLASKMAGSVTEVTGFLTGLAEKSIAAAREELAELESFAGEPLSAWDIAFWSEKLRAARYSVSDEQLRPYLPLERVLDGMFEVVRRLYGLQANRIDDVDVWHDDVRYFELTDTAGHVVGGFYTDLFARPDKRAGAWMDECICRKDIGGRLERPVAHLVCNFAAPTASTPSLLTHGDVLTLFHEFGHTLHHLLTRIDYPSVSGINGVPWDAVELPSQFMENFAWQPDVLKMLSGHYQSGDPLPDVLLNKLQASRTFQTGLQMVRQIEFALFDLRLHAGDGGLSVKEIYAVLDQIRQQVAVIEQPDFNRFAHAFSHIFAGGYAAGYYSYKWAEVLAADAWSAFEQKGIFDPDVAARFRAEILEIGGTREIGAAFAAFRGRSPRIEPLLAQSGIAGDDS